MRLFFLPLLFFAASAYSQSNLSQKNITAQASDKQRWDLNTYVWSHSHYKTGKKDKLVIDFDAIDNWPGLGDYMAISADGSFIVYNTIKGVGLPTYAQKQDSLIIQSTLTSWHKAFPAINKGCFSADGKQYVFQDKGELCFLKTGTDEIRFVNEVSSYSIPGEGNSEWIAYQLKNSSVVLQNLVTGKEKKFDNISSFDFDNSGNWLVCQLNSEGKELQLYNLKSSKEFHFTSVGAYVIGKTGNSLVLKITDKGLSYINLITGKAIEIWHPAHEDETIKQFVQDGSGRQVVFTVGDDPSPGLSMPSNTIWYYREGMNSAVMKVNSKTNGIDSMVIQPSASFSDNGNYIQFSLTQKPDLGKPMKDAVQLDVWSYQDKVLQPEQKYQAGKPKQFSAIIDLKSDKVVRRLERDNETLYFLQGNFAIIKKSGKDTHGGRFWEEGYYKDSNWVVSLKEDKRILLLTTNKNETPISFSPGGKYLVFFDANKGCHYFSYNLTTGKIIDISATVPASQLGKKDFYSRTDEKPLYSVGIAGWIENDKGLLVFDNYDIWQLDLSGEKPPINLTNGYGSAHGILFSPINIDRGFFVNNPVVSSKEPLLLRAFSRSNKYNGYYKKLLGKAGDPELLYMGPCFMQEVTGSELFYQHGMKPLKADESDIWIVQRQTANFAPNYFVTKDFKNYKQLTNLQPQNNSNWLQAELHPFKHLDDTMGQGILYKPENFDSTKKYPVLIVFYDFYTNQLYQFPQPQYNMMAITPGDSPILFLNNGYLIFTPDIHVQPLRYGPSALNIIEGAVNYLKQLPYVDASHIGGAAHSWSAKLGAYILTHSHELSAIALSEGFLYGDAISEALSIDEYDKGRNLLEEVENVFEYGNLWKYKDTWMDQTTVLNADKVSAPLLMYCNKQSSKAYQDQTTQLYLALRRLEKPNWWLSYDKGGHTLSGDEAKDYTIRYMQFFDHYLKEAPAPKWMCEGIPYHFRGIESRYELAPSSSCALPDKECPICHAWNDQYKRTPKMFGKSVAEWKLDDDLKEKMEKEEIKQHDKNMP